MSTVSYLVFSVAGTRCAIPATRILHICKLVGLERIEETQPPVIGLCYFTGRLVVGIDIAVPLRLGAHTYSADARMVILDGEDYLSGIPVDSVIDLFQIDINASKRLGHPSELFSTQSVRDIFLLGEETVCLLDPDRLLSTMERDQLLRALETPLFPSMQSFS